MWSTDEFGFLRLADAYATGSSMLPQKKNPDIAELARGKAGRLIGDLTGFLATLKGLPLAYNRDLQEDKEPLFDALDTCALSLRALTGLMSTADFVDTAMTAAADSPLNAATDLAEHLVAQACRSGKRTRWSARSCASRSSAACRSKSWCRTTPGSAPTASCSSSRAARCAAARRRAVPAPSRSCASSTRRGSVWSRQQTWLGARTLTAAFFDRDALAVAPELLNKVLVGHGVVGPTRGGRGVPGRRRSRAVTRSAAVRPATRRCSRRRARCTCISATAATGA